MCLFEGYVWESLRGIDGIRREILGLVKRGYRDLGEIIGKYRFFFFLLEDRKIFWNISDILIVFVMCI